MVDVVDVVGGWGVAWWLGGFVRDLGRGIFKGYIGSVRFGGLR